MLSLTGRCRNQNNLVCIDMGRDGDSILQKVLQVALVLLSQNLHPIRYVQEGFCDHYSL